MGQATVDLPDPLDQQPPASTGGVDDLLSQLAGDEIDRLLAEADEDAAVPVAPETPIDAPVEPIPFETDATADTDEPLPAAVPKLSPNSPLAKLNQLGDLPPDGAAGGTPDSGLGDDLMDAETQASLDALMAEVEATAPAPVPAAAPAPAPPAARPSAILPPNAVEKVLADEAAGLLGTQPAAAPRAPAIDDGGTTADERGALSAGVDAEVAQAESRRTPLGAASASEALTSKDLDAVLGAADDAPLPLLLRPLEWLDAPLAACPQGFRDTVGKVAIITAINAVAVFLYVMFFRG